MSGHRRHGNQGNIFRGSRGRPQRFVPRSQRHYRATRSATAPPTQPEGENVLGRHNPPNLNSNAPPFYPGYQFRPNWYQGNFSGGSTSTTQTLLDWRLEHNQATSSANAPPSSAPSVTIRPPTAAPPAVTIRPPTAALPAVTIRPPIAAPSVTSRSPVLQPSDRSGNASAENSESDILSKLPDVSVFYDVYLH